MRSVQQWAFEDLEEVAGKAKVEITQSQNWANTGTLYRVNGEEILSLKYDFQNRYCTIEYPNTKTHYQYSTDLPKLKKDLNTFVRKGKSFYIG